MPRLWIITAASITLLWRAGRRGHANLAGRLLCGVLLMEWSLFNLIEGTIDYHLLQLHHVY